MSPSFDPAAVPASLAGTALADELCDRLERGEPEIAPLLCAFAREFFTKVPRYLGEERTLDQLAALTLGAFRFASRARRDTVNVQVVDPEEEGWEADVTVVRALLGDRPFVVDTVREYLAGEELAIRNFIHPILGVQRGTDGEIVRISDRATADAEALVHIEIARIDDPARRDEIRDEVRRRLQDVVAATDDFADMLRALDDTAGTVRDQAARLPDRARELEEIRAFLHWLEDDHFVFLGYRVYEIVESPEPTLAVVPGSGLGILRHEENSAWAGGIPLASIERDLRARVTGGPPLIISKSNAESTVHRRGRMDYIGVRRLDDEGHVVGEHRFLGLFTSRAYAEPAEEIPILREKLEAMLSASGAPPGSHDYKEIITIFNSMPKEELFQASTAELEREVQTVLGVIFADDVRVSLSGPTR